MPAVPGIPRQLSRDHVLLALADLDAGIQAPFGKPTKYELVYNGRRYAPKAVIGLACRHLTGRILPLQKFSGGEAPGQANYELRQLGFEVVSKEAGGETETHRDWTVAEVAATVADYFAMLRKDLLGEEYNKSEHRTALRHLLSDRSDGSVEYKHQNISAVLVGMGLPYIRGYLPAGNFQALLARGVETFLTTHPGYLDELAVAPALNPPAPPARPNKVGKFAKPPEHVVLPEPGKPWVTRRVQRVDFVARDAENRRLGRLGEEFVVEFERARLRKAGQNKLARQVDRVSETIGDGLGFDVLSFDEDGSERLVEVKTTGLGKCFPFYVTATEVRCSEDVPDQFQLYRVFDFARVPRVYRLQGSLRETCRLEPTVYRAGVSGEDE
jgi:hypothetical protein